MIALIQRVSNAQVDVDQNTIAKIDTGLLVYLSVEKNDTETDAQFIAEKLPNLRIFEDANGKMNLSLLDIKGRILLVSNFTLHGDCRKGRRPSFAAAAPPDHAEYLYEKTIELITQKGVDVKKGQFGKHMHVKSINDGPVNLTINTK